MLSSTASPVGAATEAGAELAAVEELLPPPQAANRPAAPTAPVTFRKSRREIALLIFSPPNCKTQNSQGAIADPLVYNCDNKKTARKERRKLWFEMQKRAYLAILKTSLSEHLPKYPNLQQKVVQLVHNSDLYRFWGKVTE